MKKLLKHFIGKWVLSAVGWECEKVDLPDQSIVIVAPHLRYLDAIIGFAAMYVLDKPAKFLIANEYFFFPLGIFLRFFGGIPVDRTKGHLALRTIIKCLKQERRYCLVIAPRGAIRPGIQEWKTGFWWIAQKTHTPVFPACLNHTEQKLTWGRAFSLTNDKQQDISTIQQYFSEKNCLDIPLH